jgi:hypothetical protein
LACSGHRQIAREFDIAHTTVGRQLARLGRHCLLLHERLRPHSAPSEPLVLDGFRTFEAGQYWPFDLNLAIGAHSHFLYGFNEAELRRSGTMTRRQRAKRSVLEHAHGRPDPQATRKAIQELVERLVPEGTSVEIHSDEHQAYPQALRRLRDRRIVHRRISSKASRSARNPLFPVNLADLLLRHSGANHKRETIAFSKRRQGALYRAAIFIVWRNYVKPFSELRRDAPPGVRVGVIEEPLRVEALLRRREVALCPWLRRCYRGEIPTRRIARIYTHRLTYAA